MVIRYGYWLLAMVICYLILLLIIIMAIGFGYWILLMAIDYYYSYWFFFAIEYFEIQFLELEFGFSKVKH